MIFMSVCYHKSFNFIRIVKQIGDIRYHQVDAKHIIFGKSQPAIDHYDAVPVFKGGYVHSYLLKTTQRDDLKALTAASLPCQICSP